MYLQKLLTKLIVRTISILLLFFGLYVYCLAETIPVYQEAWNWQAYTEANGAVLEKANKAVSNIRFVNETEIPKTIPPRHTVLQDDRVLVVYAPRNNRQFAFMFDTDGKYILGICFKPDYDGIDIRLSPYEKGILILDWRYLPGPTVTLISEESRKITRYSADNKYLEFPRELRYSAYNYSMAELITDEKCKVIIRNELGTQITLFDYESEFADFSATVEERISRSWCELSVLFGIGMVCCLFFWRRIRSN